MALVEGDIFYFDAMQEKGGNLTHVIVAGIYASLTAGRFPAGVAVMSGTGLVDPVIG